MFMNAAYEEKVQLSPRVHPKQFRCLQVYFLIPLSPGAHPKKFPLL